jgi:anthranilate synthase component 1
MLVDLGRNDLGKISRFGTVEVEKYHCIEKYSHVMHIGSTVRDRIREDRDALDAVDAVLPAGILSVTARTADGEIMAVKHMEYPVYGVQFHPESIMTPEGKQMLRNFIELAGGKQAEA